MTAQNDAPEQVLLNDFRAQWAAHGPGLVEAFARVGASGWLVLGQEVTAFERALAEHGMLFAIGACYLGGLVASLTFATRESSSAQRSATTAQLFQADCLAKASQIAGGAPGGRGSPCSVRRVAPWVLI